jgi:hypothetical protein
VLPPLIRLAERAVGVDFAVSDDANPYDLDKTANSDLKKLTGVLEAVQGGTTTRLRRVSRLCLLMSS